MANYQQMWMPGFEPKTTKQPDLPGLPDPSGLPSGVGVIASSCDGDVSTVGDAGKAQWQTEETREDPVNHPRHYTRGGIECIDALDAAVTGCPPDEAICVANVIKYVWRYRDKTPVESLKKARWYLDRLIGKVDGRYETCHAGRSL